MTSYPPIEDVLPHSGGMVLLDAMTYWDKGEAECRLRIREWARFVVDGHVESVVTLEYMAQAVAACLGYEALLGGGALRVGMIIACKKFTAHGDRLDVGDDLRVRVKPISGNDTLSHFDCRVERGEALFSEAVLTLYHAPKLPEVGR
jgi:predicted hotdog family 3-hydroxylacyl-ACP dehydratase